MRAPSMSGRTDPPNTAVKSSKALPHAAHTIGLNCHVATCVCARGYRMSGSPLADVLALCTPGRLAHPPQPAGNRIQLR